MEQEYIDQFIDRIRTAGEGCLPESRAEQGLCLIKLFQIQRKFQVILQVFWPTEFLILMKENV